MSHPGVPAGSPNLGVAEQPEALAHPLAHEQQHASSLGSAVMPETVSAEYAASSRILAGGRAFMGRLFRRLLPQDTRIMEATDPTPGDIAELFEQQGYVREAPRFSVQAEDVTRTNKFYYYRPGDPKRRSMTEYAGLQQLRTFLKRRAPDNEAFASMYEDLTFIGEKELAEATRGLAAYWKQHLDSGNDAQICVLTAVSEEDGLTKSDQYVLDRILEHFTDEELKRYRGKLVFDPAMLTSDPERVKVILLDDWILGGEQMREAAGAVVSDWSEPAQKYRNSIEMNLITVSERRLRSQNFTIHASNSSIRVPIKAYYRAHDSKSGPIIHPMNNAYITGTHSTADYGFYYRLRNYPDAPALTYGQRNYHFSSRPQYRRARKHLGLGREDA